jgi:phage gp46-like protein
LYIEKLHNLYCSQNISEIIKSRRMRWMECVAHVGEKRNAYRILVGKPEGKRQCWRYRHEWEGNIIIDLSPLRAH